jgi:hypothetical protein
MRSFVLAAAAAAALASPTQAQAPVEDLAGFSQAVQACRVIVEGGTAPSAKATGGLTDGPPNPPALQSYFFKDAVRVDWWQRPVTAGRVHVGYDPAKNQCRVFLLATPRRDAAQRAFSALPDDWFPFEEGKIWMRPRDDGTLTMVTILPGDESKGIGPTTLTVMAHVWHNTASKDEE